MREVVAVAFVSRASELYAIRHVLDARLAEYSITGDEAESVISLVNELLAVAIAMEAGTLNVTVELDGDVARISILSEEHETGALPTREPLDAVAFALINALAQSWGLSSHRGAKYIWAERVLSDRTCAS